MRDWMMQHFNDQDDFEWEFAEPSWIPCPEDDDDDNDDDGSGGSPLSAMNSNGAGEDAECPF